MKKVLSVILLLGLFMVTQVQAQPTLRSFLSSYNLASDTVVNGGTSFLSIHNPGAKENTTVWVAVTKVSGTVGGTITLQGSIDGTTWKAINTPNTQTALATITATDASNTYHWILQGNPLNYYRVSWTGTGTMNATFTAKLLSR